MLCTSRKQSKLYSSRTVMTVRRKLRILVRCLHFQAFRQQRSNQQQQPGSSSRSSQQRMMAVSGGGGGVHVSTIIGQ